MEIGKNILSLNKTGCRMKRMRSSECGLRNEIHTKHPPRRINPKSKIQNPKSKALGFTLLEVLLAVSIFAMVVLVLFSSFRVGISSWEKGEKDIEYFQRIRSVSELLYREINSTYPYIITPGVLDRRKEFCAFFGKSDSLKFVSYANLHKRTGGLSLLELWVEDGKGLMMGEGAALVSNLPDLDDVPLREEDNSLVLLSEAKKIEFRYFDRKKRDEEGEWLERWDPKDKRTRLPLFVEITLSITDKNDEELRERLIVPIMSMKM